MPQEVATLGGGCFWCLEAVYNEMEGVKSAISGYMGGDVPNPDLPRRLHRHDRARRGRPGDLRSRGDELPRNPRSLLRDSRPDHSRPPGQRQRSAIPLGHFLSQRPAARDRRGHNPRARRGADLVRARSSRMCAPRSPSMWRRTTTRTTSRTIPISRTAPMSSPPKWRNSARSSRPECGARNRPHDGGHPRISRDARARQLRRPARQRR